MCGIRDDWDSGYYNRYPTHEEQSVSSYTRKIYSSRGVTTVNQMRTTTTGTIRTSTEKVIRKKIATVTKSVTVGENGKITATKKTKTATVSTTTIPL